MYVLSFRATHLAKCFDSVTGILQIKLTFASSQLVTSKSCACMAPTANELNIHFEILPILNFLCLKREVRIEYCYSENLIKSE